MEDLMEFERCKEEYLTKLEPEEDKINSLTRLAEVRIKAINQIQRDSETSTIVAEGYYEAIKELLTALLLKHGWKSDNYECLISFFKEYYPEYEYEISGLIEGEGEVKIYLDDLLILDSSKKPKKGITGQTIAEEEEVGLLEKILGFFDVSNNQKIISKNHKIHEKSRNLSRNSIAPFA